MTDPFETRLKELTGEFSYPATPQISRKVMERIRVRPSSSRLPFRKLAWTLAILFITFMSLMAVPTVRAAVIEFIQIGMVRIFPSNEPVNAPAVTATPQTRNTVPAPTSLIPFLESIAGETSLEEARQIANYPIALPAYPADLGEPDRVFVQEAAEAMVILVWADEENPGQVKMSLHLIPQYSWVIKKANPTVIKLTTVHGEQAAWTTGPYPLILNNRDIQYTRMIEGHVLIWTEGDLTYRLETDLSLEQAIRVAESLQAPPESTPTP
jgi:hypothetical protein